MIVGPPPVRGVAVREASESGPFATMAPRTSAARDGTGLRYAPRGPADR